MQNRTSYGQAKTGSSQSTSQSQGFKKTGSTLPSKAAAKTGSANKPTHSVYTLDAEGKKEYLNDIGVWEKDGKFGPILSVTGLVEGKTAFIVKRKDA